MVASWPCLAADAPGGARLAAEQGCLNCHGERALGAPTFKGLGERALQRGNTAEAVEAVTSHLLEEMHEKNIHSHALVSEARARAVLSWVAQGAK